MQQSLFCLAYIGSYIEVVQIVCYICFSEVYFSTVFLNCICQPYFSAVFVEACSPASCGIKGMTVEPVKSSIDRRLVRAGKLPMSIKQGKEKHQKQKGTKQRIMMQTMDYKTRKECVERKKERKKEEENPFDV